MRMFQRYFFHAIAFSIFCGISYGFYCPPHPLVQTEYFGIPSDSLISIWFLNWPNFAFHHHLSLFNTQSEFFPVGESLIWKTNIISLSLILLPLTSIFGPFLVYNYAMIATPAVSAWSMYFCLFELTGDYIASWTGGIIFGSSSYMMAENIDHINLSFTFCLTFSLWLAIAAIKYTWRCRTLAILLALILTFQFGISQEIYASLVVFGALGFAVVYVLNKTAQADLERILPGLVGGLIISLLLLSPIILAMLINYTDARSIVSPHKFSTDLLAFIVPAQTDMLGGHLFKPITDKFVGNYTEEGAYLGVPLLILLIWLAWSHRKSPIYLVSATFSVLAAVLSFGPYLHILGYQISTSPWILACALPFLKAMLPIRFLVYLWLGIAVLITAWLSKPGNKVLRYVVIALCLGFLIPNRSVVRNWNILDKPSVLTDGSIPAGSRIIILPENYLEMSYQVITNQRYELVGQGYLGPGIPETFQKWPLYDSIFQGYTNNISTVDPAMFSAFLATYGVQDIVVTGHSEDFANLNSKNSQLVNLLTLAGWKQVRQTPNSRIYRPMSPLVVPSPSIIADYQRALTPEQLKHKVKTETVWVRGIRLFSHLSGMKLDPLLAKYNAWAHPPLSPAAISSGKLF